MNPEMQNNISYNMNTICRENARNLKIKMFYHKNTHYCNNLAQ